MKNLLVIFAMAMISGCVFNVSVEEHELPTAGKAVLDERVEDIEKEYVFAPQNYGILATRITNKMIDESTDIFENIPAPTVYIAKIKKEGENLPDGMYYANDIVEGILRNSGTYAVVNNAKNADYMLNSTISEYSNPASGAPIILFNMKLKSKDGKFEKEWIDSISRVSNDDKSWW